MSLAKDIEPAFGRNAKVVTIKVDGHGFDIRPPFGPQAKVQRTPNSIKLENYFRHRVASKDNRVHYLLEAHRGKAHRAKLVKIEYRGFGKNQAVEIGADVAGAIKGGKVTTELLKGVIDNFHKLLQGNWEPSAAKVIDALGARLAREV